MRKILVIMSLTMLFGMLWGIELQISVDGSKLDNGYPRLMEPGQPKLAYYPLRVLLPFGEEYESMEIVFSASKTLLSGQYVDFAQAQVPISRPQDFVPMTADPAVYESDSFFPARDFDYLGTQYYRGFGIALFNIYPFRYNPVAKEIVFSDEFEIRIKSSFNSQRAEEQARFITQSSNSLRQLERIVENPEMMSSYMDSSTFQSHSRNLSPADAKQMIIITDALRLDWFTDYVAWRENHGISTGIYSTDYIFANYAGVDEAEKVRNFIIDAYSTFAETDSPLEYVILGGDDEIVPERGVWGRVGSTLDNRMPSDLYFSNLDGNWNADEDSIYGELTDQTDMIPELHIGRFTAETQTEFENMFHKIKQYVDYNTFSNNIAVFYGENLNNSPLTWGGDYKDDIHQYLPEEYVYSTQYQRDGTYSSASVWESLNAGVNVMNHMGHANETLLMGQGTTSIRQLTNTEYGFLYSQGCYPAAFDQRTSGDGESIGEHLLMATGGTMGFVGNTRYGWYMPGSIDGASQFYDREYFRALFEEGYQQLGAALTFSRLENLNSALANDVMRWCYMEMILFGDPSVEIKLPDLDLPRLQLASYEFDDSQGNNDGVLNPGETVRLYPQIENLPGWAPAYDVHITLGNFPQGIQPLGGELLVGLIQPGETSPEHLYFEFELPEDLGYGTFYLELAAEASHPLTGLSTGLQLFNLSFDVSLFDGRFPWENANTGKSAPIISDIDGNGTNEILFTDVFGEVYTIDEDGASSGYWSHPEQQNINRSSAMGQIDNLGGDDLAFTSRTGRIYAMTTAGEMIFDYSSETAFIFTPVIADIDGNGENDVIAGAIDGQLHVVNSMGEALPGFPLELGSSIQSELAVGKLAENGDNLIVAGLYNGDIRVIGPGGVILNNYSHNLGSSITGYPVILDNGRFAVATNTHLYLLNEDGILFQKEIDGPVAGGLIAADLSQNGSLEIIFVSVSGKLWVVDQLGQDLAGFPQEITTNFNCPPLVADITGDGNLELILHSYLNSIYCYDMLGEIVDGFPFMTNYNGATPGTLLDFDGDGTLKLITGFSRGVLMSNLRHPASNRIIWGTYRGSLSRQGSYAGTGYVSTLDAVQPPAIDQLGQNYPNPFNPTTTIAFDLAKPGNVSLEIYNTKGQKVRSLLNENFTEGMHTVLWDATDDSGCTVASGLYFYRLKSSTGVQSRKMLLLK